MPKLKPPLENLPPLPELPIFSDEAKNFTSVYEAKLGNLDRADATIRFMNANLQVTGDEILQMGQALLHDTDLMGNPLGLAMAYAYYAGLFDGVLLMIAQREIDEGKKPKGMVQ